MTSRSVSLSLCIAVMLSLALPLASGTLIYAAETEWSRRGEFHFRPNPSSDQSQHNVFVVGDMPKLDLVFVMNAGRLQGAATMHYEVRDFWNEIVDQGEAPIVDTTFGLGGRVTLVPNVADIGWYQVLFAVTDEEGPIGAGYRTTTRDTHENEPLITFAIVPPRTEAATDTIFAIDALMGVQSRERFPAIADLLYLSGVSWVRDRVRWRDIQPLHAEQEPNWGAYGAAAESVQARGLDMLYVFETAPQWAKDRGSIKLPDDLLALHTQVIHAADKYPDSIKAWAVWNEPDWTFTAETADHYAAVLKAAALGLRKSIADPLIALAPPALDPGMYADLLMDNVVAPYVDIYAFHTYTDASTDAYEQTLERHLRFINERGMGDKQVWITETGRAFAREPVTDFAAASRAQVEYLIKAYVKGLSLGIDRMFWFPLVHMMEWGTDFDMTRATQFGMLRADLTPLPAYSALAATTFTLGQAEYVGKWVESPVKAYLIGTGETDVAVIWADQATQVHIPVSAGNRVVIIDAMGKERAPTVADAHYVIEVDTLPVFVQGVDRARWPYDLEPPAAGDSVSVARTDYNLDIVLLSRFSPGMLPPERNSAVPGYRVRSNSTYTFTVEVYNFGDTVASGTLTMVLPQGFASDVTEAEVTVAPMSKEEIVFSFTTEPRLPLADHKLRIEGVFNDRPVTPTVTRLLEG